MGAAVAVTISLIALAWYVFFVVATAREGVPPVVRRAFLLYLLILVLWTVGTLDAWLLAGVPRARLPAALLGGLAVSAGCLLFARAYAAWRLPRTAHGALLGALAALGVAEHLIAIRTAAPAAGPSASLTLAMPGLLYGLSLLGLAAWLWVHAWRRGPAWRRGHWRVLLLGAAALAFTLALVLMPPLHGYGLELVLAAISVGAAGLLVIRRRPPPLPVPRRRNAGYALLGLMAAAFSALLAYGAHGLARPAGMLLILTAGLILAGVTLAFPELPDSLGLWIERRVLGSQYEARRMVEEVAEAAPAVLDLEPLVGMILERTMGALQIRWGLFALWDHAAQQMHAVAARGLPDEALAACWPRDHPLTRWLLEAGDDDAELPCSQPGGAIPALDTAQLVAVRLREEVVGVFLYGPHLSGRPYNATECSILSLLAHETSAAVANARLFNQVARARREWLQTFDALSDGVFLHDRQGRILRANRALASLVARPFDQIIARPWFDLIPAGPEPREACWSSRGQRRGISEYDLSYGGQRTLHVTVSPVVEGDEFCVHVVRDVTEERALQRQLAQSERLAAIGQMLSGVAHELNNPLTTIIGFSELLQDANVPPAVRADLQRIYRQAKHSSRIVQDLLTFARQSRLQMADVDVNALLAQTLEFIEPRLASRQVEVQLDLDPSLPHTQADAGQLQQVFQNLFDNALQAVGQAHGGGTLSLQTQATPTDIRITVADDGPGIPRDLLQRIFDPFFTTKDVGEGTGLGLSICYGIVREHGGRIWAQSELGHGAAFSVELPIRHAVSDPEPAPAEAVRAARAGRILVIEDDEAIVALCQRVLEPAGHRVVAARDGEQGLQALAEALARGEGPDLVLADLKMPRLDGRSLFERVQRDYPQLSSRFLFITGDAGQADGASFLQESGLPWLRKPFGVRDLEDAVAKMLRDT